MKNPPLSRNNTKNAPLSLIPLRTSDSPSCCPPPSSARTRPPPPRCWRWRRPRCSFRSPFHSHTHHRTENIRPSWQRARSRASATTRTARADFVDAVIGDAAESAPLTERRNDRGGDNERRVASGIVPDRAGSERKIQDSAACKRFREVFRLSRFTRMFARALETYSPSSWSALGE